MSEVFWPSERTKATLSPHLVNTDLYNLHFLDPRDRVQIIPVTRGDSDQATTQYGTNVWHFDVNGSVITISPSIHFVGHFHTPNPVQFDLVDNLDGFDA